MNLALHWCWKEWRSQRGLLAAYSLLVFACLCLGFLMAPAYWWTQEGNCAHVLSWFAAAGVLGVVLFAAPQLVRGEFGGKEDLFVRRLPGALRPAFAGKLVFLVLAVAALPLIGLLVGELFLQATDHVWYDLFEGSYNNVQGPHVWIAWPEIAIYAGLALVLVPWIWAVASWLPGGRMAVGGTALLVLLAALGVVAVLRQCPGLDETIGGWPWLWAVPPAGFVVAAIAWTRGRRGGGPVRSARFGLAAVGAVLLPPAGWLGAQAWHYHHPDLNHLGELKVIGLSPDLRCVLANGTEDPRWRATVPLRIDLQTGVAEQIGSAATVLDSELLRPFAPTFHPSVQRFWQQFDSDASRWWVYDLLTGERTGVGYDLHDLQVVLDAPLRDQVEAQVRAKRILRAPDGVRVWVVADSICFEQPDGSVQREAWPADWRGAGLLPCGHGIRVMGAEKSQYYDLTRRRLVQVSASGSARVFAVRGTWVFETARHDSGQWVSFDPDRGEKPVPLPALQGCGVLGLFDDDRLLCIRYGDKQHKRVEALFLLRVADGALTPLTLPEDPNGPWWLVTYPMGIGSLLERDPRGRVLFCCEQVGAARHGGIFTIDPVTLRMDRRLSYELPYDGLWSPLLASVDEHSVLVREGARIVRVDLDTGERTVLFPRAEAQR